MALSLSNQRAADLVLSSKLFRALRASVMFANAALKGSWRGSRGEVFRWPDGYVGLIMVIAYKRSCSSCLLGCGLVLYLERLHQTIRKLRMTSAAQAMPSCL